VLTFAKVVEDGISKEILMQIKGNQLVWNETPHGV
jgi:hypothetical protein